MEQFQAPLQQSQATDAPQVKPSGPVLLDMRQLKMVSGGGPKGTWLDASEALAAPKAPGSSQ